MSQKIIDITRRITPSLAVWPGDTSFSAQKIMAIAGGDAVNLTTITLRNGT